MMAQTRQFKAGLFLKNSRKPIDKNANTWYTNIIKKEGTKMKVQITNEIKKITTVYEMPAVNQVIKAMKDDENTAKDYAEMAAQIASGCNGVKVLESKATVSANCRVWDAIAEGTGKYDVWVEFTAFTEIGFVMGGAYLTDLWNYRSNNRDETLRHMFIRKFTETK